MKKIFLLILLSLLPLPASAANTPKSENEKILYAIGLAVSRELSVFRLSQGELEFVMEGITDGVGGKKPLVSSEEYGRKLQEFANARRNEYGRKLAAESKGFIDNAAKEKGAIKTASGLVYVPMREGNGIPPKETDRVKVNYRGMLIDGTEFDSSYKRGQPVEFPLKGVIKCWTEGVQIMKPGGKAKLVCPPDLAYGKNGSGVIPADATLVFEIELLEVKK